MLAQLTNAGWGNVDWPAWPGLVSRVSGRDSLAAQVDMQLAAGCSRPIIELASSSDKSGNLVQNKQITGAGVGLGWDTHGMRDRHA